jgi:hypothetical protein
VWLLAAVVTPLLKIVPYSLVEPGEFALVSA